MPPGAFGDHAARLLDFGDENPLAWQLRTGFGGEDLAGEAVVIAALERSGRPVSTFAAEHDIDPQRLYVWRRRLGEAERTTFRELEIRQPRSDFERGAPFELALLLHRMLPPPR